MITPEPRVFDIPKLNWRYDRTGFPPGSVYLRHAVRWKGTSGEQVGQSLHAAPPHPRTACAHSRLL